MVGRFLGIDLVTLETARLVLRPRRVEDAATYRRLWTERDPRVPAHRRVDSGGRPTVAEVAAGLGAQPGLLGVHLRDTGDVIGYCGLTAREPDEPELAFELLRAAHGHGYATEAGLAVVSWARGAGYARLWASVWDWNVASRRVLSKLGFHETGTVLAESEHGRSLLTVLEL
ncbi:GNAT family N-acetyltransferase [Cellulomonas palmilytica]|uniref:GNAT family N-acetyltransferase n=1 Tax=Cellulomonas palmilytica TaxID=2608402 RepID=UPI001F3241C2|nr:GNAT family N-acetyltransferase [Cellulomonas palmilytica]UJP40277.1 GNAT family N-acetyltransferase [Cellulomonas palmilytica]